MVLYQKSGLRWRIGLNKPIGMLVGRVEIRNAVRERVEIEWWKEMK